MAHTPTVVVTGFGIVSAIGIGKEKTLESLLNATSGIHSLKYLDTVHRDLPAGEVPLSNAEMTDLLACPNDEKVTRTSLLGRLALREALFDAHISAQDLCTVDFISGTTVGGMDKRETYYLQEKGCDKAHAHIATYSCADCTEAIANYFGDFASLTTLSTACSAATNAIIAGADRLKAGLRDIVVAGGAESLSKFHLNGFNTLMILDNNPCRPFDKERRGLNLGEGAAFLVLETQESAQKRGVPILWRLSGYGNACDAFHQTASSPLGDGATLAMNKALQMAGLHPQDIDYINAHGTGTPNNDESESQAIKRVFGTHYPPVSSTKSFTGHTTSASGAIEAAICLLTLQHHFIPANLNWRTPMENGILPTCQTFTNHPIYHVLSNAFGFGGNDSCLIFSKVSNSKA